MQPQNAGIACVKQAGWLLTLLDNGKVGPAGAPLVFARSYPFRRNRRITTGYSFFRARLSAEARVYINLLQPTSHHGK